MLVFIYLFSSILFYKTIQAQSIYKCSPVDGSLDTYGFYLGSDNGVACVRASNTGELILYMEKMTPSGDRSIAVATSKYDLTTNRQVGTLYTLFPPGIKKKFTAQAQPGFISLRFENNEIIEMVLKPNGLAWVPADVRSVTGCAQDSPQLLLNVMDQQSRQTSKMIVCAMSANADSGYNAVYGFGMRPVPTVGMEPFFYLGRSKNSITPGGPLNIVAELFDICLRTDCRSCASGYKSLTITS